IFVRCRLLLGTSSVRRLLFPMTSWKTTFGTSTTCLVGIQVRQERWRLRRCLVKRRKLRQVHRDSHRLGSKGFSQEGTREKMTLAVNKIKARGKVTAILRNIHTGEERVYETHNIITNAGDVYYAQRAAGESPTNAFDTMWLGIADSSSAPDKGNDSDDLDFIANSAKTVKSGYPKTDDDDPDHTGAGTNVVTWTFEWGAAD